MSKRKMEQPQLGPLLPPCKRGVWELPLWSRLCTPEAVHGAARQKRKLEPGSPPVVAASPGSPQCDSPAASSPAPCKRMRGSESQDSTAYKCQKDEAFNEFNSFQYWRPPLPDIDFSDLAVEACEDKRKLMPTATDVLEEMDS